MNERFYLFIAALLLVVAPLTAVWIYFYLRTRRLYHQDWGTILARITPVDKRNLRTVALDLLGDGEGLDQRQGPCEMDCAEILELVGGLEGLGVIQKNCDALIDLACYCQSLYPEALVVAEDLRQNAREIRWHLDRLSTAARHSGSREAFGEYAQRVAAIYYLMTRRLIVLYEISNAPGAQAIQLCLA